MQLLNLRHYLFLPLIPWEQVFGVCPLAVLAVVLGCLYLDLMLA